MAPAPVVSPSAAPVPVLQTPPAVSSGPGSPAPPPPAAPALPSLPQQAAIDLGAVRHQVSQALARASCALGTGVVQDDGTFTVSGYASASAISALRQQLASLPGGPPDWQMRQLDPVFCSALTLLRPIAAQGGAPVSGLALTLANGQTTLGDGERILPRVTMGDFAGEVRVDYLGHDGSVVHLHPTVADPAQKLVASPAKRLQPGALLSIGESGPGRPDWVVGPPYGTDMIIVVASSSPLLAHPPARNEEDNAAPYLRNLESGIARVRRAGGQVAGTLLLVDTLPKL